MPKKLFITLISVVSVFGFFSQSLAQDVPTLTASLDSLTPPAQSLSTGSQYVEVARITLSASIGDVYLNGFYLGTNISDGLNNFSNLFVYDAYDSSLVGTLPNQSENPYLLQLSSTKIIGNGQTKTYIIKVNLSSSAAGNIRVGFSGLTFSTQAAPVLVNIPIYGNAMTLPGTISTPTPTATPTPTPSATPTPNPSSFTTPQSMGFTSLSGLGLKEGDIIGSVDSNDPDIYIVNDWGYKRLFLNPAIFGFYGHLKFTNVKKLSKTDESKTVTSGLFRNCEINDKKIYAVEVTGEDTGKLHWLNESGSQAITEDPNFFHEVFCINTNEFNWYAKGTDYTSVSQIPNYSR